MSTFANPAIQAGTARRGAYHVAHLAHSPIRKFRIAKGLTQPEAANLCQVGLRTFQRAEAGDVVDMATKRRIERALGAAW